MTSIKLMLNKDRVLNNGKYPLVFQLIHQRRRKLIYTPYKLFLEEFNIQNQIVEHVFQTSVYTVSEIVKINKFLVKERHRLEKIIGVLDKDLGNYGVEDIVEGVSRQNKRYKLLSYMDERISSKTSQNKRGIAAAYKSTRSSLSKFIGRSDINMNEITSRFVREYEEFLRVSCVTENTIAFYMRNFRTIYNSIVDDGYVVKGANPFRSIKTSPSKTIKRALDKDTMRRLVEMQFDQSERFMELSRDVFLFSFYTRGMSFVDIAYLKRSDIVESTIVYCRQKTAQQLTIGVSGRLQNMIDKYSSVDSLYILPILDDQQELPHYYQYRSALAKIIRTLKVIGKRLNLPQPLTTYVARHTWATLAKNQGVAISAISESLGHTSEKTTRIYLKSLDKSTLDKINETIIDI